MPRTLVAAFAGLALVALANAALAQQPVMVPRSNLPDMAVDAATRDTVIDATLRELERGYVYPEVATAMRTALRERIARGEYASITSANALADSLTAHLRAVSHDKHLRINYSADVIPERSGRAPGAEETAAAEEYARRRNYGFEKVDRLQGNVGYIDLRGFMDGTYARAAATAAMATLANTDALVIDLRANGGGSGEAVAWLASYLWPEGKRLHLADVYDRVEGRTTESWTEASAPGRRYAGKEVYVLTSARTASAAEEFAFDLQNLKRATLVGETTAGAAHIVDFRRIHPHFEVKVPIGRGMDPVSKQDWEGVGVKPDVDVRAEDALKTAQLLALQKLEKTEADPKRRDEIHKAITMVETGEPADGPGMPVRRVMRTGP